MNGEIILLTPSGPALPVLIAAAGARASPRFVEFFAANIRNKNTREAYRHNITAFLAWCDTEAGMALETPIRFLIAETETGFTLLAALYYARLFGVEDRIEISPLFEIEEAFERGERVIEEALKSPHYREYLEGQGRLAVQFGFSDSGRFIGQMPATFRIDGKSHAHAPILRNSLITPLCDGLNGGASWIRTLGRLCKRSSAGH
jgi:hypothetical protein